ncbi:MAG TPA: type II toxin-antitoxin system VapC family toxin [Candidatus Hydrogenedentes bacterium]|nr:type II toxin-antitoxin system VapC family toxin [Candidatus Hydrogenedentota bacterium]HOS01442.1 type II toxin-antitoxin system VapC family toxin [Candidatus Hydrogenedentota bacterium]
MKPKIYIETSVISYLTARPSGDLVVAACQQITRDWWDDRRGSFDLFISARVIAEATQGDGQAAEKRLEMLRGIPVLEVTDEALSLAERLMRQLHLPQNAVEDALHIATAVVSGMDYLLSWNCRHIANAHVAHDVLMFVQALGYPGTLLCTPQALLEDYDE